MNIQKFKRKQFGTLTTITSPKTGKTMFIGKEVAEMWGHSNLTQSLSRLCDKTEYIKINLSNFSEFKSQLLNLNLIVGKNAPTIMLIFESALYKLALSSSLDKAKPFRDWVTQHVLPSIRETGYYSIADSKKEMSVHTSVGYQKHNSKKVNELNYNNGGVYEAINHNRLNCKLHTGMNPKQVKQIGREMGLKSIETTSAKDVIRKINPPLACAMSFTDNLVRQGYDINSVSKLSLECAVPLFQGMIELGAIPFELNQ
jgi:prophage antirepressor-like protein